MQLYLPLYLSQSACASIIESPFIFETSEKKRKPSPVSVTRKAKPVFTFFAAYISQSYKVIIMVLAIWLDAKADTKQIFKCICTKD